MKCIFCLEDRPSSVEHVFPDAIGGTLTIERVCKPCNDRLGAQVDSLLTDHGLILLKRAQLGMRDSSGRMIDPFRSLFRQARMADDSAQKVELRADAKTDELVPYLFHKSTTEELADGTKIIRATIDASDTSEIGKIIQRTRRREGLPPLSDTELEAQIAAAIAGKQTREHPEIKLSFDVDIREYKRAVAKIAYELAWLWLGDDYLADPTAGALRKLILEGIEEGITARIEFGADFDPFALWKGEGNAHIGIGSILGSQLSVSIRIFDSIAGAIIVSGAARTYCKSSSLTGEGLFVWNDPQTGRLTKGTLSNELLRMTQGTPRAF